MVRSGNSVNDLTWSKTKLLNEVRICELRISSLNLYSFFNPSIFESKHHKLDADGCALKVKCCYFSGVLCDNFFVLCWPSIQVTPARRVFAYPSPSPPCTPLGVQLLSLLHCAPGTCCILMQAIKVTNLGGPDTEQTSIDGNRGRHGLTSWLIALLIDCFPACGVHASSRPTVQISSANCYASPQINKRSSNLIRILAVEIRILKKNEFNIPNLKVLHYRL